MLRHCTLDHDRNDTSAEGSVESLSIQHFIRLWLHKISLETFHRLGLHMESPCNGFVFLLLTCRYIADLLKELGRMMNSSHIRPVGSFTTNNVALRNDGLISMLLL